MSSCASPLDGLTDEVINHLGSRHCAGVDCAVFLRHFCCFKPIADAVEKASRSGLPLDIVVGGQTITAGEFKELNNKMGTVWKAFVDAIIDSKARSEGLKGSNLKADFVNHHMTSIEGLGYSLASGDKIILEKALLRLFDCEQGPAPFSLIEVATRAHDSRNADDVITAACHMRAMATHWLRHPPECFSLPELEELVVLSLFHGNLPSLS